MNKGAGGGLLTFGRGQALHFGMAAKMQGMTPTVLQGVDPASPAHLLETRTSTRSSIARHELCETSVLRRLSVDFPLGIAVFLVDKPVMQPVGPSLPEFNAFGKNPVSAPEVG